MKEVMPANPELEIEESGYHSSGEATTNIALPLAIDFLLAAGWLVFCLIGFVVMFVANQKIVGAAIIAVPTFIGMILKPSFALSIFMLVLPSGTAIAVEGRFTLNKGIGIAMALSFLLNIMLTRPKLKMNKTVLWLVLAYYIWTIFAVIVNSGPFMLSQLFTKVQYIAFFLIVYWILETNKEKNFLWILRSFIAGTCGTVILAFVTGAAIRAVEESADSSRFTATAGGAINANALAAMLALAMLSAVYLLIKDRKIVLRIIYAFSIFFLGIMLFKTGSRGTLVAIIVTFVVISFGRQLIRNPVPVLGILFVLGIFLATGYFLLKTGKIQEDVVKRLTDVYMAKQSIADRMIYNKAALNVAMERLTGGGYGTWFTYTDVDLYPHNDLMYSIGVYGFPAGFLFLSFIIGMMLAVKRIPFGFEKMYAKAILVFLLLIGLKGMYVDEKFYWVFWVIALACEKFGGSSVEQEHIQPEQSLESFSDEEKI